MRISISNIAWDPPEDEAVLDRLHAHGVDRIDIAPGKYFADPINATPDEIAKVRGWWGDRGITLVGMQSLLFGTQGLNLFGDDGRMLDRLQGICRLAGALGIHALTFGSPRNRDRSGLSDTEAEAEAVTFFRRLGDTAVEAGVIVCLEPNPVHYNCNFMTGTADAAAIVRATDHPGIMLQLDVGAIALNGEDPAAMIDAFAPLIGHVHASEPDLVPIGAASPHALAAEALRRNRPDLTVTIEMLVPAGPDRIAIIDRSLASIVATYGDRA